MDVYCVNCFHLIVIILELILGSTTKIGKNLLTQSCFWAFNYFKFWWALLLFLEVVFWAFNFKFDEHLFH